MSSRWASSFDHLLVGPPFFPFRITGGLNGRRNLRDRACGTALFSDSSSQFLFVALDQFGHFPVQADEIEHLAHGATVEIALGTI